MLTTRLLTGEYRSHPRCANGTIAYAPSVSSPNFRSFALRTLHGDLTRGGSFGVEFRSHPRCANGTIAYAPSVSSPNFRSFALRTLRKFGAPERTRTSNPLLRRQVLCPVELRAQKKTAYWVLPCAAIFFALFPETFLALRTSPPMGFKEKQKY